MAALSLPTFSGRLAYRYEVELSGRAYQLALRWLEVDGRWSLDVATGDGVPLLSGLRVVADSPLLRLGADDRLPPGEIVAYGATPGRDPGRDDLSLIYVEPGRG